MDIEVARKLIQKAEESYTASRIKTQIANRYYLGDNDIMHRPSRDCDEGKSENVLRNADNKISFNFYGLLVNQKASYLFTAPPLFDIGTDSDNEKVANILGDDYSKKCKDLCVDASNAGVAWVHYWIDDTGAFQWFPVKSTEIIPIYSNTLDKKLQAVLRTYQMTDDNGETWNIHEYWTDTTCTSFKQREDTLAEFPMFEAVINGEVVATNEYQHGFGEVPFVAFYNNNAETNDLDKIKGLCDTYDKTFSGFVDDLEDIQEVILVVTNYGGTDPKQLLNDLKYYKTVQVESAGDGDRSGLSTLTIDIPVEARDKLLELTRKSIFTMGQGVDPEQQGIDHTSGEAMKFTYSLLELKAGLTETEFRRGFGVLLRAICRLSGIKEPKNIIQTWQRTSIRNNAELVSMCQQSVGILSTKTILKNHPFVENADDEAKELEKEKKEKAKEVENYQNAFMQVKENQNDQDKDRSEKEQVKNDESDGNE